MSNRIGPAILILLFLASLACFPIAQAGAESKVGVEGASATKLQLMVGQSYFSDTEIRVRSVSLSKPGIVEVTVENPSRVKITGKTPGSATIVYWTEAGVPSSLDLDVWEAKAGSAEPPPPAPAAGTERDAVKEEAREVAGPGAQTFLVAVLPLENLSGKPGPLQEIRQLLAEGLKSRGVALLPERELDGLMARHRMRYTGGINMDLAQAFLRETGTKAVLVTSLEYFSAGPPPKISLVARLVSTGENATILWMKSIGLSGDDHPGILGLGLISAPDAIVRKAIGNALDSLVRAIPGGMTRVAVQSVGGGKFRPKRYFRSPELDLGGNRIVRIAVVPFLNIGTRKNAGSLMELQFVNRLAQVDNVRVIEPGVVREELLRRRVIMQGGLSEPQTALLFAMLDADLILTGVVAEYDDSEGAVWDTKVAFSVLVFDVKSRRVMWSSRSYNRGDDGVFFFDLGEVKLAARLASEMAWAVIERMIAGKG